MCDVTWRKWITSGPVVAAAEEGWTNYNNQLAGSFVAGQTLSDGVTVVPANSGWPFAGRWNTGDVGFGTVFTRWAASTHRPLRGDFTSGQPVTFELGLLKSDVGNQTVTPRYQRNSTNIQVLANVNLGSVLPAGISVQSFSFNASATSVGSVGSELMLLYSAENDTNKGLFVCGCTMAVTGRTGGVCLDSYAFGGWSAFDHLPPADGGLSHTDAQLTQRNNLFDTWPDVIFIQLGTNMELDEITGSVEPIWAERIVSIIDRRVALASAAGRPAPLFVLVATWQADGTVGRWQAIADYLYDIAQNRSDCAFLNLYKIINDKHGAYSTWQGTLLSDGIHQSTAGADEFGRLLWQEIVRASTPSGYRGIGLTSTGRKGI